MSDPKNLLEALELVRVAAVQAKAALGDGDIDLADLPKAVALWQPAKVALEGIDLIDDEIKAMDAEGAAKVINKVVEVVDAVVSVLTPAA